MLYVIVAFATILLCFKDGTCLEDRLCYSCEPSDTGSCLNPKLEAAPKIEKCSEKSVPLATGVKKQIADFEAQDIDTRIGPEEEQVYECYSYYYDPGTEGQGDLGMYRGCIKINKEVLDSCEFIIEDIKGTVSNCKSCRQGDNCNNVAGGGAAGIHFSMTILAINLLICLYIFQ